ncbi:hypothetical protein BOX24_02105 [Leptospirillum ferriphilum]|uniref:Uncharacterized protein n=1 Tax=Leptospirillum ferriphilum TaxID=178606 RepID=A0A1V3SXI3_9BACT|nr:hypothetical protein BOX24_02105 [Leptospirillum ferriphilum]
MQSYNVPDLCQEDFGILLRRGGQALLLSSVLPDMLAQEIAPVQDVRNGSLLLREGQTHFFEKGIYHEPYFVFKKLSRVSGDDNVFFKTHHVGFSARRERVFHLLILAYRQFFSLGHRMEGFLVFF